jgi:hypothetical protein
MRHPSHSLDSCLLGCDIVSFGEWFPTFQGDTLDCLTLEDKGVLSLGTSEITHQTTRRHIPKDVTPQQHCCEEHQISLPLGHQLLTTRKQTRPNII